MFETTNDDETPFTYAGCVISRNEGGMVSVNQGYYSGKFKELELPKTLSDFMSQRMKLAWLANSRSDLLYSISLIAQVTKTMFETKPLTFGRRLHKAIQDAYNQPASIQFPRLNAKSLLVIGYPDAG